MAVDKVKKVVIWMVAAFVAYSIFKSPERSGDIVHNIWAILRDGVGNIGQFFDRILNS